MKIAVFDFDGTLYNGDSLKKFCFFIYLKQPFRILFIPYQLFFIVLFKIGLVSKIKMKTAFLFFLYKIGESKLNDYLIEFWENEFPSNFNEKLLLRIKALKSEGIKIIIISASPQVFIHPFLKLLEIDDLVGSKTSFSNHRYYFLNDNRGESKINYLKNKYPECDYVEAYSDNKDDISLLKLAKEAYFVKNNRIIKIDTN